jgi:tyrosyl-tRNA synthetase
VGDCERLWLAKLEFISVHREGSLPTEIPDFVLPAQLASLKQISVVELMVAADLAKSKSEARRLITQKGVRIDGEIVTDIEHMILPHSGSVIRVGRRKFIRLTI